MTLPSLYTGRGSSQKGKWKLAPSVRITAFKIQALKLNVVFRYFRSALMEQSRLSSLQRIVI